MNQPTETVTRPEPGLARGKWEAPPWAFWVALAVVLAGTTLYVLRRLGMLRLKRPSAASRGGSRGTGPGPRA